MGWKIEAWDTEDFAMVAGTHDPAEAAKAWNKYVYTTFGKPHTELEFYDELDWTRADALWTFEKLEGQPFDAEIDPRPGMFPYLELLL